MEPTAEVPAETGAVRVSLTPGAAISGPAPVDLALVPVGQRVHAVLLVLEIEHRDSARSPFTTLTLGNSRSRLPTAPFWAEDQSRLAGIERGTVAEVVGEVGVYLGRRQLKVSTIHVLPRGSVNWRRLLPAVANIAPYWEALDRWRHDIRGPRLRHVLGLFFDDPAVRLRYEECPASTAGHHAELGGLLRHTYEVAAIGRGIAGLCGADPDLVLAGALLHDLGKLESYRWQGVFEVTECGALLGHVTLGMRMLDRRVARELPAPCTDQELTTLLHLIASHHGRQEFGAAVSPMTLEAEVLHFADNASAKSASMSEALTDPDNFSGDALISTRTLWQLDRRRAYRGRSDWGAGVAGV